MARDDDRSAVYAAELAAFDGTDLEQVRDFETLADLTHRLLTGAWWAAGSVDVRRARSDARSSTTRCAIDGKGPSTIRLATEQMTIATVAHELAHALAGVGHGHDAVFRQAFLDVVAVVTNINTVDRRHAVHVDQLAAAFAADGLAVGGRSWPAPPSDATGAIAL